jgi:TetR/AcrR family transcriptional regulator, cholesterol catabolism regulator
VSSEASPGAGRVLSPTQAATRARLLAAAVELATAHGYDGFTMRDVAASAGMSTATAYQYYGSKDQVLVDALVDGGSRTSESVGRQGAGDPRPPDARLLDAFIKVVRAYEQAPRLYHAMFVAYLSRVSGGSPEAESPWSGRSWLDRAVGDDVADREVVVELLQSLVLASMISLIVGTPSTDVVTRFRQAIHLILPPAG